MPHKFLHTASFNRDQRFQTNSAILTIAPYQPTVMIVGTYNDGANPDNNADFFYGRNFFWPIISNLAHNNAPLLIQRRIHGHMPALGEILNLCEQFKITFADLITDVAVPLHNHDDRQLNRALGNNQAVPNQAAISKHIINTASITHVYATSRFSQQPFLAQVWKDIVQTVRDAGRDVQFGHILTPSGQGRIKNIPGLGRVETIARYWVWANHLLGLHGPLPRQGNLSHLNHAWLAEAGVNVELF